MLCASNFVLESTLYIIVSKVEILGKVRRSDQSKNLHHVDDDAASLGKPTRGARP
jgi:hypothetical protein